jgi:hypothetical protein
MDAGARRWMLFTVKKNYWRVSPWIELDDLIQDGYLQYQRVLVRYPDATHPAHIMRLFQRCFINYLHDIATKRTRELAIMQALPPLEPIPNNTDALLALAKAPPLIRQFLHRVMTDDAACAELRKPYLRKGTHRETVNERLCRVAGVPPNLDFTKQLLEFFQTLTT